MPRSVIQSRTRSSSWATLVWPRTAPRALERDDAVRTPDYMAPEVLEGRPCEAAPDIFSWGGALRAPNPP